MYNQYLTQNQFFLVLTLEIPFIGKDQRIYNIANADSRLKQQTKQFLNNKHNNNRISIRFSV